MDTGLKRLTLLTVVPLTIFGLVAMAVLLKRRSQDPFASMEFLPMHLQTTIGSRNLNKPRSEEADGVYAFSVALHSAATS